MQNGYIYAGTRVKSLENSLLNDEQVDMLLAGKSFEDSFSTLHGTFLGRYIANRDNKDLSLVLEEAINDSKNLLCLISPEKDILDILWLKYDFYNLKVIIKGSIAGLNDEEIEKNCFGSGKYTPQELLEHYRGNTLSRINIFLQKAMEQSRSYEEVSEIDRAMNLNYFEAIKSIAWSKKNKFAKDYVTLLIDIFNIQANLRALSYGEALETPTALFVSGGSLKQSDLENKDRILENIHKIGGKVGTWKEAVEDYKKTGDYVILERISDNYLANFLKESSYDIFSPASLFSYFHARKNNIQLIRSILVGKQTGLSEYEIRKMLRKLYGGK